MGTLPPVRRIGAAVTRQPGKVLLHIHGEHQWLDPNDAQRHLDSVPTDTCPKCRGTKTVVRDGEPERCPQCQGLGRVMT